MQKYALQNLLKEACQPHFMEHHSQYLLFIRIVTLSKLNACDK